MTYYVNVVAGVSVTPGWGIAKDIWYGEEEGGG
jgi:hypothetical protein